MNQFLLRAKWIVPITSPPVVDGALEVEQGRITKVYSANEPLPRSPTHDLGDVIIIPGLVNSHTHLDFTLASGFLGNVRMDGFYRFLHSVKENLNHEELVNSAKAGLVEGLRSGTTTFGDVTDSGASFSAVKEMGARAVIYREFSGFEGDVPFDVFSMGNHNHEDQNEGRIVEGVAAHSPYSVGERQLSQLAELAVSKRLPISIHAAEQKAEVELFSRGKGPIAWSLNKRNIEWKNVGTTPFGYLQRIGFLRAKPALVHSVHVVPSDIDIIAKSESKVVSCPRSNSWLGNGIAPVNEFIERNLVIGLGTDSSVSGTSLNLLEEMRYALLIQRAVGGRRTRLDSRRCLEMATMGGARSLGLDDRVGSIEGGKNADLAFIRLRKGFKALDPVEYLGYVANESDVLTTMVGGNVIYSSVDGFERKALSWPDEADRVREHIRQVYSASDF